MKVLIFFSIFLFFKFSQFSNLTSKELFCSALNWLRLWFYHLRFSWKWQGAVGAACDALFAESCSLKRGSWSKAIQECGAMPNVQWALMIGFGVSKDVPRLVGIMGSAVSLLICFSSLLMLLEVNLVLRTHQWLNLCF